MPLHLQEFQRESFQGFIENMPPLRERILSNFMPNQTIFDINFSYNVINGKYVKTASITGFNAGAPLRDKQGLEKNFGSVAKVQHGFRLDEEELMRFNKARDDQEQAQVVEYVYNETEDLVEGVRDIEEWMRAQAIYKGALNYVEGTVSISVDFGVPAGNKLTATTAWSDKTAKIMDDLRTMRQQFKDQNKRKEPTAIHMSETVELDIMANDQVKQHIFGSTTDQRIITRDMVQSLFTSLGLPRYTIQEDIVDTKDGEERLLPERRVAMLGSDLGNTYLGITVENNYQPGMYIIPEIKETNPPQQAVFVGETVFPALKRPTAVAWMDV